jgi:membrane protein YqaA with SNARE-associated domain
VRTRSSILIITLSPTICYNAIEGKMRHIIGHDWLSGEGKLRKKVIPLLVLLLVIVIWVGIFYFYKHYPGRINQLIAYGYLGAFLLSLFFNATVILPMGAVGVVFALGAVLPSALVVGLAGGIGAAIGEITGYMAGYSGRGIAQRSRMYSRVEGWVRRWGELAIFLASVVPFAFDLVGIAAGVLRFPFWKFFVLCWLGRTIMYIAVATAGARGFELILP